MKIKSIGLLCLNLFTVQVFAGIDLYHCFSYDPGCLETPKLFYAKTPVNINSNRLLVVRGNGGFVVGLDFNYLTPYDNQLDYAVVDPFVFRGPTGPIAPSTRSRIHEIQPHDNFGYGGEIGYAFPHSGTDILFHYQTFSDHSSAKVHAPAGGTVWDMLSIYSLSIRSDSASSRSEFDFDQGDLILGNEILAGRNFILHPYLGAAYVKISKNMHTDYLNAFTEVDFAEGETFVGDAVVSSNNYFRGIGPRIGLDAEYLFTPCFTLVTHANTSLYLGVINNEVHESVSGAPEEFMSVGRIHQENTDRAVPALEAKLGLAYRFPCIRLKLEAGYQVNHYFNALNFYRASEFILNLNYLKNPHDFNLYGPYLNVSLYDLSYSCGRACEPFHVGSIRCPGGFEFAIGMLRLSTDFGQMDYGVLDPVPLLQEGTIVTHPSDHSRVLVFQPTEDWGWQADFAYHFPCTAFDIHANYQTMIERNSQRVEAESGFIFNTLSMIADVDQAPIVSESVITRNRFQYDKLDLDIGQLMGSSPNWQFRLFGGLRYSNLDKKFETLYENLSNFNLESGFSADGYVLQENIAEGVGPRLGSKLIFQFNNNFSLTGEASTAILVADKHSLYRDVEPSNETSEPTFPVTVFEEKESSEDEIIPNLEAKLGLNFHTCVCTHVIGIELGYLVNHYFNADTRYKPSLSRSSAVKQVSDIDVHGYYVNVSIGGTPPNCRPVVEPYGTSEFVGGYELAVEAIFLQLTSPPLDYAVRDPNPAITPVGSEFVPGPNSEVAKIQPHSTTGYRFHLGYAMPCSTFDVAINYFDYTNEKTAGTAAPEGGELWMMNLPARNIGSAPWFAQIAQARLRVGVRSSNFEFAKNLKLDRLNLRFLTGGSYLHVDESRTITYKEVTSRSFVLTGNSSIVEQQEYKGLGPRFGIDSLMEIGGGFGFVGHAANNYYIGILSSDHIEANTPGIPTPVAISFNTGLRTKKQNRVVTELELRGGVNYVIPLRNSYLSLELGYECDHLFNVMNALRFTTQFSEGFVKQETDISLTGPYIKVQLTL